MNQKLAIITTHPIQYNAPWFRLLARRGRIDVKVFYTWGESVLQKKYDPGFDKIIEWDIPLLDGYTYEFVENISPAPGSHHFKGIDNPHLITQIEKWNPNAVLVFGWAFKSHLKILRYFKGKKPVFFRGDSTLLDEPKGFSLKNIVRQIFLRWVYRHIDVALYVGSANKSYFKKMGIKEHQLIAAPHAIDNIRFAQDRKEEANQFRLSIGVREEDILILFAGKLESKKNPQILLEAFNDAHLPPSVHCLFVGNGSEEMKLKKQVEEGQIKNVHFIDFQNQSDMPVVYQSADLFCLPSRGPGETWGLAINEAMAAGCAVLVSDQCGGAEDLIEHGVNGFIFKSGDTEPLQHFLKNMVSDKILLKKMGMQSQQRIQKWNYNSIAETVEKLLIID